MSHEHPDMITVLNDMATTFRYKDLTKEAEKMSRQVLEMRVQGSGEKHHETIMVRHNLACALMMNAEKLRETEEMLLDST